MTAAKTPPAADSAPEGARDGLRVILWNLDLTPEEPLAPQIQQALAEATRQECQQCGAHQWGEHTRCTACHQPTLREVDIDE